MPNRLTLTVLPCGSRILNMIIDACMLLLAPLRNRHVLATLAPRPNLLLTTQLIGVAFSCALLGLAIVHTFRIVALPTN